jgi:hypothetical protein
VDGGIAVTFGRLFCPTHQRPFVIQPVLSKRPLLGNLTAAAESRDWAQRGHRVRPSQRSACGPLADSLLLAADHRKAACLETTG